MKFKKLLNISPFQITRKLNLKRTGLPLGYASPSNDERQHCAASYITKTSCFLLFYSFIQETAEYFAILNNKATKT